ncbi:MAG: hypothetical protein HY869_14885 [Chloroflexi bacterium]|nr:hypothetical protein [Chloroflexota bacterium]
MRNPVPRIDRDDPFTLNIILGGSSGDPSHKAGSDYQPDSGVITIMIYDEAFSSTAGDLAVTIDHEFCHANQSTGASCLNTPQTNGTRYYNDPEGYFLNEAEGRVQLLSDPTRYGYGLTYGVTKERISAYKKDITNILDVAPNVQDCPDSGICLEPCR